MRIPSSTHSDWRKQCLQTMRDRNTYSKARSSKCCKSSSLLNTRKRKPVNHQKRTMCCIDSTEAEDPIIHVFNHSLLPCGYPIPCSCPWCRWQQPRQRHLARVLGGWLVLRCHQPALDGSHFCVRRTLSLTPCATCNFAPVRAKNPK